MYVEMPIAFNYRGHIEGEIPTSMCGFLCSSPKGQQGFAISRFLAVKRFSKMLSAERAKKIDYLAGITGKTRADGCSASCKITFVALAN